MAETFYGSRLLPTYQPCKSSFVMDIIEATKTLLPIEFVVDETSMGPVAADYGLFICTVCLGLGSFDSRPPHSWWLMVVGDYLVNWLISF